MSQIALPFGIRQDAAFENFYGEVNAKASSLLKTQIGSVGSTVTYLMGPEGSGKTHLSIAVINYCTALGIKTMYLSIGGVSEMSGPEQDRLLEHATTQDLVVLEDLHNIEKSDIQESWLFRLFNDLRANGGHLIVTANCSVDQLPITLEDLKSRYRSGLLLKLFALDDTEKQVVLQEAARSRGLEVSHELATFLFRRIPRGMAPVLEVLDRLDQASWTNKKKLTIPFVKKVMGW